jgi:ATP-dependent DNA helicase RecG
LPKDVLRQRNLITEDEALRAIHLAENTAERERAQTRLTFDEAVGLQWALVGRRYGELSESGPVARARTDGLLEAMRGQLPFELTAGQSEVLEGVSAELSANRPMNRMLQGEVGSGKTIVSVMAMLQMIDAGYQCALLAPTEVLAAQHARSIRDVLGPLAMAGQLGGQEGATRVALLTGSMSAQQKKQVRDEVASGDAGIVIGTHALLQDAVEFHKLGMVVVDEQHRFGVEQRDRLRAKAPEGLTPHLLVMTATPIPRTLALSLYGDLDLSVLDELPPGRTPVVTRRGSDERADEVWQFVRKHVAAGRQAYIVYPVIEGSSDDQPELDFPAPVEPPPANSGKRAKTPSLFERPTLKAATQMYEELRDGALGGLRLGLLHGRLNADDKEIVMRRFQRGELDVLVSTTVIEVGVDVPNATVMVIEHAERFGLAQLHQLRGRVGRGSAKSYCILMTGDRVSAEAEQRLDAMVRTQDGFELAELDLELRGPGEFFGTRQAGLPDFRIASLVRDRELLELAKREAAAFVVSGGAEATEAERAVVAARLKKAWQRRYGLVEAG